MGKQGWQASKWDGGGGWDSSSSQWQRAAWKPQRGDGQSKIQNLGYRDVKVTGEESAASKKEDEPGVETSQTATQIVQKAVNQARESRYPAQEGAGMNCSGSEHSGMSTHSR